MEMNERNRGGRKRNDRVRIDVEDSNSKRMEDAPKSPAIVTMSLGEMPSSDCTEPGEANGGIVLWERGMTMSRGRQWLTEMKG